jgi:hypothetical protein
MTWVHDLVAFIEHLNVEGTPAGPILAMACFPDYEGQVVGLRILRDELDLDDRFATWFEFFGLGSQRARKIFEPLVAALIYHHLSDATEHASGIGEDDELDGFDEMCGCCAKGNKLLFKSCRSVVISGFLMLNGTCTNCYGKGSNSRCSFTRKCSTTLQTAPSYASVCWLTDS